jgi:hypothetical protein
MIAMVMNPFLFFSFYFISKPYIKLRMVNILFHYKLKLNDLASSFLKI